MYTQTQTKLYKFSDKGLDINGWAKGYYPETFKKILTTGYNQTTITDFEILDGKVTLILPTNHGYLLERVIRFTSPTHTQDYVITEVTATSISFNDPNFPTQITNPITIKVAPLDWELVYEQGQVHIYKFKDLDHSDLYLRLFYLAVKGTSTYRGIIYPCVGRSYDESTGYITDTESLSETREILSAAQRFSWELGMYPDVYYENQALNPSLYGNLTIVGSLFHFIYSASHADNKSSSTCGAILPVVNTVIPGKKLPYLIGNKHPPTSSGPGQTFNPCYQYVENTRVSVQPKSSDLVNTFGEVSYIPEPYVATLGASDRISLNGTSLYFNPSSSFYGNLLGVHYFSSKANDSRFPNKALNYPYPIMDSDNFIKSYLFPIADGSCFSGFVVPMEEIHLGYKV